MIKKNILGIVIVILIVGAFVAGYVIGKGSNQVQVAQTGKPGSQSGMRPQTASTEESRPQGSPTEQPEQQAQKTPDQSASELPAQPTGTENMAEETGQKPQSLVSPAESPETVGQVFYGTVVPYDQANIQSTQGGTITMLNAKEGDSVKKGEVLVRFDDREKRLELEQLESAKNSALQQVQTAESNFKTVQANFDRTQKLFDDGLVSKQELDSITNQLESARASLNSAKESVAQADTEINMAKNNLKDFQVEATLSGVIDVKNYNLGEVYQGGGVIYHVIQIEQVYIEVEVPETYLSKVKETMEVKVTFDALEGREWSGIIERILPSGASDNRNFTAKVLAQNPDLAIKPGMFARVEVML